MKGREGGDEPGRRGREGEGGSVAVNRGRVYLEFELNFLFDRRLHRIGEIKNTIIIDDKVMLGDSQRN